MISSFVKHLTCWACERTTEPGRLVNLCECGMPLRVDYDLDAIRRAVNREQVAARPPGLWRYRELMPLPLDQSPVTLGEGGTPLLDAPGLTRDEMRPSRPGGRRFDRRNDREPPPL